MKKTARSVLTVLLALTLTVSLAAPCLAADAASASVEVSGTVVYTSNGTREVIGIPAFTFKLTLKDSSGNILKDAATGEDYATVTSSTLGRFSLELPFTAEGSYFAHISQIPGTDEYTVYDKAEYDILIAVTRDSAGKLEALATVYNFRDEKLSGPASSVSVEFSNSRERYLIPQYAQRTLTDKTTGVTVSGSIYSDAALAVTVGSDSGFTAVIDGRFRDTLTITIPVEAEDGVLYTVFHVKEDESTEYFYVRAKDKTLTAQVTELGFFTYMKGFDPNGWKNVYSDVAPGSWYYDNVAYATQMGLMEGDSGKFSPDGKATRAMFLTVLYRIAGNETGDDAKPWYSQARAWAVEKGISDGENMEGILTREQMAAMIYNYEKKLQGGGFTGAWMFLLPFDDVGDISGWAYEGVAWCFMGGVVEGEGSRFNPQAQATRAQVAAILSRYCEA